MLYHFGDFALDTDRRELHRGPDPVGMAPQVFDLLEYLIENRNRVVSKDDLIAAVWDGRIVSDSALSTRINAVRCAIDDTGEDQRLVRTLPRKGVRFTERGPSNARAGIHHCYSCCGQPAETRIASPGQTVDRRPPVR